jgi:hypothetical protein
MVVMQFGFAVQHRSFPNRGRRRRMRPDELRYKVEMVVMKIIKEMQHCSLSFGEEKEVRR